MRCVRRHKFLLSILLPVFLLTCSGTTWAQETFMATPPPLHEEVPKSPHLINTKIIPLPIFATDPSEGNTYGFMPVLLKVRHTDGSTAAIYAPSLSWNAIIHLTGTFRYYLYPSKTQTLMVIPSVSTNVNWGLYVLWLNQSRERGRWTDQDLVRVSRNIFFRYFGLGPGTQLGAQSSYTREWTWV